MNDRNTIYMNDPRDIEEVCVGYGDPESRDGSYHNLYLQRYADADDDRYEVWDEVGNRTNYTFCYFDYAGDWQAFDGLRYIFSQVYGDIDPEVRP